MLLSECTGDDIWSVDYCRARRVPETWISELVDAYESGFDSPTSTIFFRGEIVNQFEGIRDVDLASQLGKHLGVDVESIADMSPTRASFVQAIKAAIEEE